MRRNKQLTSYQKKTIIKAFQAFSDIDRVAKGSLNFSNLKSKHLNELVVGYLNLHNVKTSHGKPFNLNRLRQFYYAIRPHKEEVLRLLIEASIIKPDELEDDRLEYDLESYDSLAHLLPFIRESEGYNSNEYKDELDQYLAYEPEAPTPVSTQLNKKQAEFHIQELYSNLRANDGSRLYDKPYFRKHVSSYTDLEPII